MSFGFGLLVWLPGKVGIMTENKNVNAFFLDMEEMRLTNPKCCSRLNFVEFIAIEVPCEEFSDIRVFISCVLVLFLGNQTEH